MTDPEVGATVDRRYVLRRAIAQGGMGIVFEAHQTYTGRTVALKLLPGATRRRPEHRNRLLREAHALTTARHPGFVEVLDAGECDDLGPYLAMEMLEGRTLEGILASKGRLSVAATLRVGRAVCEALSFAHARGVVHRDLKPGNVFIARSATGEEVVKLFDLGVASLKAAPRGGHEKLTMVGEVLGTPEYMAPEQLLAQDVDHRCDLYALGITLHECLTGAVPVGGSYAEVLVRVASKQPLPSVRASRPDLSEDLDAVLRRATAKARDARFPDARSLGSALAALGTPEGEPWRLLSILPRSAPSPAPAPSATPAPAASPAPPSRPTEVISLVKVKKPQEGPPKAEEEPRRHPRAPFVTPVRIFRVDGTVVDARSEDISEGGLLARVARPCDDGERVRVCFALPNKGDLVTLEALTRWVRGAPGRSVVGLEFTRVPPEVARTIDRFVRSHAMEG